jgi:hypothetical protein
MLNQLMKRNSNFRHNISTNKENMFYLKCVYTHLLTSENSRDSSVDIGTGWTRDKICLLSIAARPALGLTQPPMQWVRGALSPGVKRPGREADHSPPSSAEVKNGGAIPPLPNMSSWHSA